MSWKLKMSLGLSLLWVSFWFYVYYVVFAKDPTVLVIFICGNPVLLGVLWGLYFCFKTKKPSNPGAQNIIYNIPHPLVEGAFKNPMFFSNFYTIAWIFFLVLALVLAVEKLSNNDISKIVLVVLYILIDFVIYSFWAYRANKNAHLLGASRMMYSPKEAVLWVAMPLMTWIGNYYVIKELWKASKNPVASLWQREKNPVIVKLRWLFMVLLLIMEVAYRNNPINSVGTVFFLVFLIYIILSILIFDKISRMQRLHYQEQSFDALGQRNSVEKVC